MDRVQLEFDEYFTVVAHNQHAQAAVMVLGPGDTVSCYILLHYHAPSGHQ